MKNRNSRSKKAIQMFGLVILIIGIGFIGYHIGKNDIEQKNHNRDIFDDGKVLQSER